jgi:predicted  nucleic acid-binding Zn-ribbon protein
LKDESEFKQYRKLESRLNFLFARRESLEDRSKQVRNQINRIEDEIDELTKELLAYIKNLGKS